MEKHIHIVGICGVATSAIAIAFKKIGWKVTGSDKGFFPPVSTELEKSNIDFYAGWHPEKIGKPDFAIVGTASGTQNPEVEYLKENNIPFSGEAEARGKFIAKENSIVCAGTWGKTSTTALLSFILKEAGFDPSYMMGGVSLSTDAANIGNSKWSVIEGDEYKSSPWDNTPKFMYLKPSHLLLTSIEWDHADLYPTPEDFLNAFRKLITMMGDKKMIVACNDNANVNKIVDKFISYGKVKADFLYKDIKQDKNGIAFKIVDNDGEYEIKSQLLGAFQAENITGCFAMAKSIGIDSEKIIKSIAGFKGIKRRMEKRFVSDDLVIIDDIAHSGDKASSTLKNIKDIFKTDITVVFEPNIGGRKKESIEKYDNAFSNADEVIIPRLTKLKVGEGVENIDGKELSEIISKTHKNVHYIEDDTKLVEKLSTKKGVIAFLGSHGFRNMIEEVVEKLK